MGATVNEKSFKKAMGEELPNSLLGSALDWIRDNMTPDGVFDQQRLNKFVGNTAQPDEVFNEQELESWAREKGFVKLKEGTLNTIAIIQ